MYDGDLNHNLCSGEEEKKKWKMTRECEEYIHETLEASQKDHSTRISALADLGPNNRRRTDHQVER